MRLRVLLLAAVTFVSVALMADEMVSNYRANCPATQQK